MNKRLKALRQNMNMTQKQFAKYLGITSSILSQYENDRIPIPDAVIDRICSIFYVDKLWLIYGVNSMSNSLLSQIKKYTISIIANIDDNLFNHLIQNIQNFIEMDKENNIEKKIHSYQKELEAEKRGPIYIVLLNINAKKFELILKILRSYHGDFFISEDIRGDSSHLPCSQEVCSARNIYIQTL